MNFSLTVQIQRGSAGTLLITVTRETRFYDGLGSEAGVGMAHWLLWFLSHILLAKQVAWMALPNFRGGWDGANSGRELGALDSTNLRHAEEKTGLLSQMLPRGPAS